MTKKQLLQHLQNDVYCRLAVSKISGIGIIAIRDIPKGINPFQETFQGPSYGFTEEELSTMHPAVQQMVRDYFATQVGKIWIPALGLNTMDLQYYINTSEEPNIVTTDYGNTFITTRDIATGEELTSNYEVYDKV